MSALSKTLIAVAGLLLLALVLAWAAPSLIDRDAVKRRIEAGVQAAGGQPVRIDGDVRLRLLPSPRADVKLIRLGSAGGTSGTPPLSIERLQLDVALLPLLTGRIALDAVVIDGLRVSVGPHGFAGRPAVVAAPPASSSPQPTGGAATDVPPPSAAPAVAPPAGGGPRHPPATAGPGGPLPPSAVVLPPIPSTREFLIRDAQVRWHDPGTGSVVEIQAAELRAGPIAPGEEGRVEGRMTLTGTRPRLAGDLRLTAALASAADLSVVRIASLRLRGDGLVFGDLHGPPLELNAAMTWRPPDASLAIDDIRLTSAGLAATGSARLLMPPRRNGPALTGRLDMPPGDLRAWLEAAGLGPLRGTPQTLRQVGGSTRFELAGTDLSLSAVRLRLDDTRVAGAAVLGLRWGTRPAGVGALALDRLDLDRYLGIVPAAGASAASAGMAPAPAPEPPATDPPLPEPAGGLTLRLAAGELRAGRLVYRDLTGLGVLNAADWSLDTTAADVYDGHLEGRLTGTLPAHGRPTALTLDATATDVRIGPLLADAAGQAPISGRGGFDLDLSAVGADALALRQTLAGSARLALRDAALTGFDLDRLIGIGGNVGSDTPLFSTLSASAKGKKGVFRSDDIRARSPLAHLDGRGKVDIAAETLALNLEAVLVEPPNGAGIRELEGIPIPIRVRGPWTDPSWKADVGAALREAARRALDKRVKGKGGLLDQLEERIGVPGLRGLLGQ